MSARFISAVLAAGALVAMLSTAAPAEAGHNKEFKRFLGAAVGLYILGRAIEHHEDRGRVTYQKQYRHGPHKKWKRRHWHRNPCGHHQWSRHDGNCWRYR